MVKIFEIMVIDNFIITIIIIIIIVIMIINVIIIKQSNIFTNIMNPQGMFSRTKEKDNANHDANSGVK